jgi:hypothetical protein
MTTKKKTASGKAKPGKLKLKKETIKDLEVKGSARGVRGGVAPKSAHCETLTYCGTQCMCKKTDWCKYF